MLFAEIVGFWLLVGMAMAGWRRRGKRKDLQILHIASRSDGRHA